MEHGLTMEALKGKQSVRATFRLPQQIIDLLALVAGQLGIKQKSLFDQLMEDATLLESVAEEAREDSNDREARRPKTFVVSRHSLRLLNEAAKRKSVSRDLLVEISIKRLLPIIKSEAEKHMKRKALLKDMKTQLHQGRTLLEKTGDLLGKEDFLYTMVKDQVALAQKNFSTVSRIVKKGKPMEDW